MRYPRDAQLEISIRRYCTGEAEGLFALEQRESNDLARFAPIVLLRPRTPTISFNGAAFGDEARRDLEIEDDLERLDAELEALALEPEDEANEAPDPIEGGDEGIDQ